MREEEIKEFLSNLNIEDDKALYGAGPHCVGKAGEPVIKKVRFQPFKQNAGEGFVKTSLSHLENVKVDIEVILGSSEIKVREFLNIDKGSLVELDTPIGENAMVFINEQNFAEGEIIVVNDRFAVRITGINQLPNSKNLEEM